MRMIYIIIAAACLYSTGMWSQSNSCVGVPRGITTNPEAPVNTGCPTQENTFEWRQTHYPFYWSGDPNLTQVWSPFWNSTNVNLALWNETYGGKDYQPADGWELIRKGVAPDVINFNYVALYNKFTSILRVVFALPPTQQDYQFIQVSISFPGASTQFPGGLTALLHPRTGKSQAMDQRSVPIAQTSVVYTQVPDLFMYADFPVEYDPCTCLQNSDLQIQFSRITNQELTLYGRNISVERSLASIQSLNSGFLETDFLTQTYSANNYTEGFAGAHTFATYDRLESHYHTLKQQQAELNKQYAFFRIFNEVIKTVGGVGAPVFKGIKFKSKHKIAESAQVLGIQLSDLNLEFELTGSTLLEGLGSVVNLFGAPIKKKLDATGNQVNSLGATMLAHGEMALKGNLTTLTPDGRSILFRTPGQNTACNHLGYPLYNEVLGRFALLETPKAKRQLLFNPGGDFGIGPLKIIPESIKFTFNPAAKIKPETEIWAAIRSIFNGATSPVVPLSCLENLTFSGLSDVELVLFVDYYFEDANQNETVAHALAIYSHPVEMIDEMVFIEDDLWPTTPDYPSDLTLSATHFTQSQRIFAWSNITITGDLTADPGVTVEIVAPNIEVLNESFIGSDIWLRNDFTPFGACTPIAPVTTAEIASFCASNQYKANRATAALAAPADDAEAFPASGLEAQMPPWPFELSMAPNPVRDYGLLRVWLPESSDLHARLSDLRGQTVKTLFSHRSLPAGEHLFNWSALGVAPSMYVLTVRSAQGVRSLKVVVQE